MSHWQQGWDAEQAALEYLQQQDYTILAHRYRTPHGEVDIIASLGDTLIFMEVKQRGTMTDALYAITPRQQQRIQNAALVFLAAHPDYASYTLRFDAMVAKPDKSLYHLPNAWEAMEQCGF